MKKAALSLDAHVKFSADLPSALRFIVLMTFHDSFELGRDENGDRSVVLNYKL